MIKKIYCICARKDIEVWKYTSRSLLQNIESEEYILIVPEEDILIFKDCTPNNFNIQSEINYIGRIKKYLNKLTLENTNWYIQQFIKLQALYENRNNKKEDIILLWDADTIPLKRLFFEKNNKLVFYKGSENHSPYFFTIRKLLGLEKKVNFSFIAQCMPIRSGWIEEFFNFIEKKHNKNWFNAVFSSINFSEKNSLSEYEILGTFIYENYLNDITVIDNRWQRFGKSLIGNVKNINKWHYYFLLKRFDYISFESWDVEYGYIKKLYTKINKFKQPDNFFIENFLKSYFSSNQFKLIIQIGANDGIQNDPIRKFLKFPGDYQAILVEPIEFYVQKLLELYKDRPDITILKSAIGCKSERRDLYYIPPELANEMNGNGPMNNWAHGQGSFSKDTIIYWINKNSFRGSRYIDRIPFYINSIVCDSVDSIYARDLLHGKNLHNALLLIDVQGYELEVLKSLDFENSPRYIIYEDDQGNRDNIASYLIANGYKFLGGKTDKVYEKVQ
jgi:FkbM family methyltransferase